MARFVRPLLLNSATARRDIAMVFQFYALYPSLTVAENLAFPLHAERISEAEIAQRVKRIAGLLDLSGVLDRVPGRLAEGEKQRVAVGRAIIRDPLCFLFDEPLSRLDIALRQEMRGQIKQLLSGLHKATIIVTHDQIEALTIGDRIAVMRDGLIEQVASPHDIFARPSSLFVAGFIGTPQMNLIEGTVVACDAAALRVRLLDQEITLALEPGVQARLAGQDALVVGIRPRAFGLVSEPAEDTLSGDVDLVEPMGAETLIHLRIGAQDVRFVASHRTPAAPGQRLHVRPRAGQVHLFRPEGDRIVA